MIKTTSLTKTIFNHQNQSQTVQLYIPSTTSSSGSMCETDPSSLSSSYKSNNGANHMLDDINGLPQDESTLSLINLVDKLKRELTVVKQAKSQLSTLYKVSLRKHRRFSLVLLLFSIVSSEQTKILSVDYILFYFHYLLFFLMFL